jgi:hypothetical protein
MISKASHDLGKHNQSPIRSMRQDHTVESRRTSPAMVESVLSLKEGLEAKVSLPRQVDKDHASRRIADPSQPSSPPVYTPAAEQMHPLASPILTAEHHTTYEDSSCPAGVHSPRLWVGTFQGLIAKAGATRKRAPVY